MEYPRSWEIRNLDTGEIFVPQISDPNLNVSKTSGAVIGEVGRFGEQESIVQWIRGKNKVYNFQTVLYAETFEDGVGNRQHQSSTAHFRKMPPARIHGLGFPSSICRR